MNLLDVLLVSLAVLAAIGGYRAGLVARAFSWAGLVAGLVVASTFLPDVVELVGEENPSGRFMLATVVLLGGSFAGQALGVLIASRLRPTLPDVVARADRVGGALTGVFGVLVGLWLLLPGLANVPGELSTLARGSSIARLVDDHAPRAPDTLQALRDLVGVEGYPTVFDALRPAPDTGPPPEDSGIPQAVIERAVASTVRVEGEACRRIQEGSGFAVGGDLIVTNAHVVAGVKAPNVITRSNRRVPATVVLFDPDRDLAILQADARLAALPIADAKVGDLGAVLGYPGGGPLEVSPYAVREEVDAVGRDLYDDHRTTRRVLILAAELRGGDSGGALVNAGGEVVGVAFAIAPDDATTAYALDTSELREVLSSTLDGQVGSGPCLS